MPSYFNNINWNTDGEGNNLAETNLRFASSYKIFFGDDSPETHAINAKGYDGLFALFEDDSSNLALIEITSSRLKIGTRSATPFDLVMSDTVMMSFESNGRVTFPVRINAGIGIDTNPASSVAINVQPSSLVGTGQLGINVQIITSSSAINSYGILSQVFTAAGAWTLDKAYGIMVETPSKGAGSAIQDTYGVYIKRGNGSRSNYGLYVEPPSGGSNLNTTAKFHVGDIGINITNLTEGSNTTKVAGSINPEFDRTTTVAGILWYMQPTTENFAFTMGNRYGMLFDMSLKGAASDIQIDTAIHIGDVTRGSVSNYAIRTGLGYVAFGDRVGINGKTPVDDVAAPAVATDLATALTLVNDIRTRLINFGIYT